MPRQDRGWTELGPLLWAVGCTPGAHLTRMIRAPWPRETSVWSGDKCPHAAWSCLCLILEPVSLGSGAGGSGAASSLTPANTSVDGVKEV